MRLPFLLVLLAATPAIAQTADGAFSTHRLRATVTDTVALGYLVALPDGYADDDRQSWPLMLFLHGAGERGDSLALVAVHGPPKLVAQGERFPFILVAPQAPAGGWWDARELGALLDEVAQSYRVDPDRVMVTGLSMGGYGAWSLAETFPDRFSAVAPVCGGGTPVRICAAADVPIWAFHGALDNVVPVERSIDMVRSLRQCNGDVRLTIYPDAGHDSWTETYADPAFYDWMLAQRRAR